MQNDKNLIEFGFGLKPHGIKGGVTLKLYNENGSSLKNGSKILLKPYSSQSSLKSEGQKFTIDQIHFGNKVICYLKEIKDRNDLESILPFTVFYPREELPELDAGEFYLEDLVGLKVLDIDGNHIGKVLGHYDNGAQTVLSLSLKNQKVELPFVEVFFPHIHIDKGFITLNPPEFE